MRLSNLDIVLTIAYNSASDAYSWMIKFANAAIVAFVYYIAAKLIWPPLFALVFIGVPVIAFLQRCVDVYDQLEECDFCVDDDDEK